MLGVVFTFDDDLLSHVVDVQPMFKEFGYSCTFFLNARPGHSQWAQHSTMGAEQMFHLAEEGFEIGNHTLTHNCIDKYNPDDPLVFECDVVACNEALSGMGIVSKPVSFAYGGYLSSDYSEGTLKKLGFRFARHGYKVLDDRAQLYHVHPERPNEDWIMNNPSSFERDLSNYYYPGKTNPLEIMCAGLFCPNYTMAEFTKDIDRCPKDAYAIFTGHVIQKEDGSEEFLRDALTYCKENNLNVIRMGDLPL